MCVYIIYTIIICVMCIYIYMYTVYVYVYIYTHEYTTTINTTPIAPIPIIHRSIRYIPIVPIVSELCIVHRCNPGGTENSKNLCGYKRLGG